jgi:hypothetical protein
LPSPRPYASPPRATPAHCQLCGKIITIKPAVQEGKDLTAGARQAFPATQGVDRLKAVSPAVHSLTGAERRLGLGHRDVQSARRRHPTYQMLDTEIDVGLSERLFSERQLERGYPDFKH